MVTLVSEAIKQRIVAGDWAIHSGPFSRDTLKVPSSLVTRERKPLASGENPADLLRLLPSLPWGTKDIAIVMGGLDEDNPAIAKDMRRYGYGNVDSVFLSLAAVKTILVTAVMDENDSDDGEDDEDDIEDEEDDADEGGDDDSDEEEEEDEDGDRAKLDLQDSWILTGQGGPLWDDLDLSSHLITFARQHFGPLCFGETIV
jgi:hypothetical protein